MRMSQRIPKGESHGFQLGGGVPMANVNISWPARLFLVLLTASFPGCDAQPVQPVGRSEGALRASNGMHLNGMHLNGMHLNGMHLNGMHLNGTLLSGVRLEGTDLIAVRE